jgi:hypothetical protein
MTGLAGTFYDKYTTHILIHKCEDMSCETRSVLWGCYIEAFNKKD